MAYIVTERCVDCKYTDCCVVCPVNCFWEIENPKMLVIDPDTCIDCHLCVPECPIHAIWRDEELPKEYEEWTAKNRDLFPLGVNITEKKEELPGALKLQQIQEREKARGWVISEPTDS